MIEDDFINIDLEDVDDGTEAMPQVSTVFEVISAMKKHKEGADYPYIELITVPVSGDEKFHKRKVWTILSQNPSALWHMARLFPKLGLPKKAKLTIRREDNMIMELLGKRFRAVPIIDKSSDNKRTILDINSYAAA